MQTINSFIGLCRNAIGNRIAAQLVRKATRNDSILVNEYPKSGGSWLGEQISAGTGLTFIRNNIPRLHGSQIFHGHYQHWNVSKSVLIVRDPRAILVSLYHHVMFPNGRYNDRLVKRCRAYFQFSDVTNVKENLPRFSDSVLSRQCPTLDYLMTDLWKNSKRYDSVVRYEDLRQTPQDELQRVLVDLGYSLTATEIDSVVRDHEFSKMQKEQSGNFIREGKVDGWRKLMSSDWDTVLRKHWHPEMERFGYYVTDNWE